MTIFYPDASSAQAGISFAGCAVAMVKATESTNYINLDYAPAKVRGRRLLLRLPPNDRCYGRHRPTLQEGDTGAAVTTLQTRLNVWGAALTVDGVFGPGTLAAVKAFQARQNPGADGIVGPQTWAALNKNPASGPAPYPAPTRLALSSVSVSVHWNVVTVNGQAVASYTVEAVGLNGQVYVRETPTTNSVVLSGLTQGWTYNILVWANGSPVAPPHASLQVTV